MTRRQERHAHAIAALVRLARTDPAAYDELADGGDLRQRVVDAVDEKLEEAA